MKKKRFRMLVLALLCVVQSFAHDFKIEGGRFLLDGNPITLICGEMHYPRIPKEYWRDRIRRAKAMGLNTISTYVFWNIHERQPGKFDFKGQADLARFIHIAQEEGMFVILRPGPYVCAEWDFGGFPYWLQNNKKMVWRSDDPDFLAACKRYINRLGKEVSNLTVNKGGPILMVQVENEYGSYGNDRVYLGKLRDMLVQAGFDAPFITCDGAGQMPNGYMKDVLPTVNGAVGPDIMRAIDRFHPGGPYFVAEFYPAWFDVWGKRHSQRDFHGPAQQLDWMLSHNISVSMYMFHGGTNFAYTNGANTSYGYEPQPTSYDYNAPLGEYGNITPKYMAFREVIQRHLPAGTTLPDVPKENTIATFMPVHLERVAPLRAAFGRRFINDRPLTMEEANQDFGYIHYETTIPEAIKGMLVLKELRDYAIVWINGKRIGTLDRRYRQSKLAVDIPAGARLEILVENVGRINYGPDLLNNHKGITEKVLLGGKEVHGWTTTPLPLYALKKVPANKNTTSSGPDEEGIGFYRTTFDLTSPGDVFLDMRGWNKGAVWVNGHSIGKYWHIGPQQTLYVPGPWLKKGKNEVIVFEMDDHADAKHSVAGLPAPILDSVRTDPNAPRATSFGAGKTPIIESGDCLLTAELKKISGPQHFDFASPATMRHICLEVNSSYDNRFSCLSELTLYDADGKPLPKDNWTVVYASTYEPVEGDPDLLIDGKNSTYWHSKWQGDDIKPFPHRVIIDLGEIQTVTGITLQQRNPNMAGCVKDFKVYGRPQFFLFKTDSNTH